MLIFQRRAERIVRMRLAVDVRGKGSPWRDSEHNRRRDVQEASG